MQAFFKTKKCEWLKFGTLMDKLFKEKQKQFEWKNVVPFISATPLDLTI